MLRQTNSAFFTRMQESGLTIAELIDVTLPNGIAFHWTTANGPLLYTLSGALTEYKPFPGNPGGGAEEAIDLSVSVMDFVIANTGGDLQGSLLATDFALAAVNIGQVFTDTPDLGRMAIYDGKVGDFAYTRQEITGQARNLWKSLNIQWPYYSFNDKCVWRFGSPGCGFNTQSVTINSIPINASSSSVIDLMCGSPLGVVPGTYDFGRLTVTAGTNSGAIRAIRAQTGDMISLSYILANSDLTGMEVAIFPGCKKRLVEDCTSRFNNSQNFFGFPSIPLVEDAF